MTAEEWGREKNSYDVRRHALVQRQEKTVGKDGDYTEKLFCLQECHCKFL